MMTWLSLRRSPSARALPEHRVNAPSTPLATRSVRFFIDPSLWSAMDKSACAPGDRARPEDSSVYDYGVDTPAERNARQGAPGSGTGGCVWISAAPTPRAYPRRAG